MLSESSNIAAEGTTIDHDGLSKLCGKIDDYGETDRRNIEHPPHNPKIIESVETIEKEERPNTLQSSPIESRWPKLKR